MHKIDDAEAIRPAQRQPGRARGGGNALLRRLPFASGFAEASREYDDTTDATSRASRDGILDGDTRNEQHRGIDAVRQIIDGADAGPISDVRLVPADEVNATAIAKIFEIPQREKPAELGSGEMPTIAIERGRIKREMSIAGRTVTTANGLQPDCFFRRIAPRPGRYDFSSRNWVRPSLRPFSSS